MITGFSFVYQGFQAFRAYHLFAMRINYLTRKTQF
nr:MAG TPA: hypothetical protein [Caudoviricetes sp.]DAR61971.1 MAG TPA: hypothetical protein [Caudoviricetes sp.]DAV62212.1 MAG TPA: hypothetical protein [Caudoviricetes sp.]